MSLRRLLTMTCMSLILSGCAVSPDDPPAPERYELRHEGERLIYRGKMSDQANDEIAGLLKQHAGLIEWLEIESPGGEVMRGLDLGELVLEHELGVKVIDTGCHSSCANYVFTAGRQKVISEGSLVTWHGSALQRSLERSTRWRALFRPSLRRSFQEWKARQKAFFQRIGVDERITIVGQDLKCQCSWALSAQDMARFGLDADVPENYTDTNVSEAYGDHRAKLLELPDDVFERIRPREDA